MVSVCECVCVCVCVVGQALMVSVWCVCELPPNKPRGVCHARCSMGTSKGGSGKFSGRGYSKADFHRSSPSQQRWWRSWRSWWDVCVGVLCCGGGGLPEYVA